MNFRTSFTSSAKMLGAILVEIMLKLYINLDIIVIFKITKSLILLSCQITLDKIFREMMSRNVRGNILVSFLMSERIFLSFVSFEPFLCLLR